MRLWCRDGVPYGAPRTQHRTASFPHTQGYTLLMQLIQLPHDLRAHMNLPPPRTPKGKTEGTKVPTPDNRLCPL